jgi:hypothetical protein
MSISDIYREAVLSGMWERKTKKLQAWDVSLRTGLIPIIVSVLSKSCVPMTIRE